MVNKIAVVCSLLTFSICMGAGFWILSHSAFTKDDAVWVGIGLYFIGKAFFVGPMLLLTALNHK